MRTQAQTETIGLIIIVLILAVAMLFYLSYTTQQAGANEKENLYTSYTHNEMAVSLLQTLLKTTIQDCAGVSFEDLVYDCGTKRQIICSDGTGSCQKANETARLILNRTLDEWDLAYGFSITYSAALREDVISYNCTSQTVGRAAPGLFLVPYFPLVGNAKLELGICG